MTTNYFEANLALLKDRDPKLAERVMGVPQDPALALTPQPDGAFDLKVGDRLLYGGRPVEAAQKTIQAIKFTYPKFLVFYGVGLGYHIQGFFKAPNPISQSILIIEKSLPVFRKALEAADLSRAISDPRVMFMVGVPQDGLKEAFFDYINESGCLVYVRALEVVIAPNLDKGEQAYYLDAAKTLKEGVAEQNSVFTCSPEDAYRGFMNIVKNLPAAYGVPSFEPLEQCLKGMPGIIVSTGPSLRHSIPWLKEVGDRAVIACADSALRVLGGHGIKPHFTACLERTPETRLFFEGIPPTPDTWLVTNPIIWPQTYNAYQGPKIHLMRPVGQLGWFFPDSKIYYTGRSVAHFNYVLLKELGCDPIFLVGQDLAFDRTSGKSHAEGSHQFFLDVGEKDRLEAVLESDKNFKQNMVEGNNGEPILTTRWYKEFKETFEIFFRKSEAVFYNVIPAEYGAKIKYTQRIDPAQAPALIGNENHPIRETIGKLLGTQKREKRSSYVREQSRRIDLALENLKKIKFISMEVMDASSEHFFQHNPEHYWKNEALYTPLLKKMEQIADNVFNHEDKFYFNFLTPLIMDRILSISQAFQGLFNGKVPPKVRLEEQFGCIMNWFNTAHIWASRMEAFIQRNYPSLFSKKEPVSRFEPERVQP